MPDSKFDVEKRWFVQWTTGVANPSFRLTSFKTIQEALDEVLRLVEKHTVALILFHDTEADVRVRWSKARGYEHVSVYARDYIRGLTRT